MRDSEVESPELKYMHDRDTPFTNPATGQGAVTPHPCHSTSYRSQEHRNENFRPADQRPIQHPRRSDAGCLALSQVVLTTL